MMWFFLLLYIARTEPVDLNGTNRLVLRGGSNPCEGQLEIHHDKIWGYVGDTNWEESTEKVVCRSTQCGEPLSAVDVIRLKDKDVWLDEINCKGKTTGQLWDCEHPGFSATIYRPDQTKWMKCSDNITISLERYKCAGTVKYTDGYFCGDTWDEDEANVLCKSLGCGTFKEIPKEYWEVPEEFEGSKKMVVNCSGIEGLDNLWQCAPQPNQKCSIPAFVICTDHKRLQIKWKQSNVCQGKLQIEENSNWRDYKPEKITADAWCNQMYCDKGISYTAESGKLKCSENVSVSLLSKGSTSKCYGEVHIKKNNAYYPVCGTVWSEKDAEVVCKELQCGKVISIKTPRGDNYPNNNGWIMDNVDCSGSESSLWYCKAKRNNIKCSSKAFVVCADSIAVRLEDGPGKCAGRVEINYEGQWQRATHQGWTLSNSAAVCHSLRCGKHRSASTEIFSQGSVKFLDKDVKCDSDNSDISECIKGNTALSNKPVMITCEGHKMVFLEEQCSGQVGIDNGTGIFWLSGYNKTWNKESADAVCRQMHCGVSSSHGYISKNKGKEVWIESYKCSSNAKSLFECDKEANNQNDTIATVNCSGNIKVNLTKACWGNVNVCMGEMCGGVCNDTWTRDKSKMLCQNLQCGIPQALDGLNPRNDYKVIVKSLHTAKEIRNLNQSNIVKYEIEDSTCKPAYVVCSGSVEARLITTRSKCSGNVELKYEGQWLPVCKSALNDSQTQNIFCEQCGQPMTLLDFGPKKAEARAIHQIKCQANKPLEECEITASNEKCTLGGLQCSNWRNMEVKFNASCSGYVYVYSQGNKSAVSFEGWNRTEGETLCRDLKCGNFISGHGENTRVPFWDKTFSCGSQKPKNIWDCEKALSSSKQPQQQQLYIKCEGEPKVRLSGNCSGEVTIDNINVCQSNDKERNKQYSDLVCKERGCSHAISSGSKNTLNGDMQEYQHVRCEDYHGKLGQCNRFKGKCNGGLLTVNCVKSIKFHIDPICGGLILVEHQNKLEKVCLEEFPDHLKNKLCDKCGGYVGASRQTQLNKEKLKLALNCSEDYKSIQHCVKQSKGDCIPAEIYCANHVPSTPPPPPPPPIQVVPIILGVGLTLIVVILIVVFVRVCIVRRAKRPMYAASRTFEREEVEFESGDYEDVKGKSNEMEALSQGMFRPNSDIIMESDGRSNTSLPYDDIDEAVEAQTSPAATAAASGDKFFREGALDQSSDGVTYEVDDPQENYDDIEAGPEISQIKAEVHNSPQTTPESVAVAPSGLVRGDEDYLVPGQDG